MLRDHFELVWIAFTDAIERFWNNRFIAKVNRNEDEINFLRLELSKERNERVKLLNYILELNSPKATEEIEIPISLSTPTWNQTRKELERKDKEEFDRKRKENIEKVEKEVGIV